MAYRVNVLVKLECDHVDTIYGHRPEERIPWLHFCEPCRGPKYVVDAVSGARERDRNGRA